MSGQLCLKWNNHSTAFKKLLSNIFLEDVYSDGTIVCQGKFYPVHRFVLSTCSVYFEEMFRQCNHLKSKYPFIIVKDIHCDQMEALLNYMYKGEVNVPQEQLPELIKAAEAFKIKGLAVSDEEPNLKLSRKRPVDTSSNLTSKKSKSLEERVSIKTSPQVLPPDRLISSSSSTICDEERNCQFGSTSNAKNEPIKINSEQLDPQEELMGDLMENKITSIKEENQPIGNISDDDSSIIQSFEFNPGDENFNIEQPTTWDIPQTFGSVLGTENDHTQRCDDTPFLTNERTNRSVYPEPKACSYPGCTFYGKTMSDFERHYRTHTGDKPFQCPHCSYSTAQKNNLDRHVVALHSDVKAFKCPYCQYETSYKYSFKLHVVKHKSDAVNALS